jgi:hypothetical protein
MSTDLAEVNQVQAVSAMPADMALLKMENDQIFAVAKAKPREPAQIVAQLRSLLDAYPAAAAGAIYSKPVGTVQEVTCGRCGIRYQVQKVDRDTACVACDSTEHASVRPVKKFAEGLSIRAAETIRSVYGYTRLATKTDLIEDDKVRITGTVVDYASGNITTDERIVSPWYKAKTGQMTKTPEDRFLNVVVKAEKSKLRRDIILDNTPAMVKTAFRDYCEQKNGTLVTQEEIDQKIIPAFATFGLTPAHLDKIIGTPRSAGWTEEHRLQLRKILVALKQDETTVRELLDGLEAKPKAPETPRGGATLADLTGKPKTESGKTADVAPEPKPEPSPAVAPPDDLDITLTEWLDEVAKCSCIREVQDLEKRASEVPEALRPQVLEACLARKKAIRDSRGGRGA